MTVSIHDLEILADAMVFAVLVTIGGVISWVFGRELSRRHGLRRDMRVALAGAALIAVGAAGAVIRSSAGDAVPVVARVASAPDEDRSANRPALRLDEPESRSDGGTSSRLEGSIGTFDAVGSSPVAGSAGDDGPADDPGTIPGSDSAPTPPPPPPGDGEPSDDPPDGEPSEDPPDGEPSEDPPDGEPSDEGPRGPDGEGPPGPDGEGPPGPDGEGPPGIDGEGPPGQGGG